MFNTNSPKQKVMLERKIIEGMVGGPDTTPLEPMDSITFRTFTKKFNAKYGDSLLQEQRELLNHYISSFSHDDLETKIYLNREITRLKQSLSEAVDTEHIATDSEMVRKTNAVRERLESLSKETSLNKSTLLTIMRTQELVKEIYNDASNS